MPRYSASSSQKPESATEVEAPSVPWGPLRLLKDPTSLGRASGVLQHPPGLYLFCTITITYFIYNFYIFVLYLSPQVHCWHGGGERGEAEGAQAQEGVDPPRVGGAVGGRLQHDLETRERQDRGAAAHAPQAGSRTRGRTGGAREGGGRQWLGVEATGKARSPAARTVSIWPVIGSRLPKGRSARPYMARSARRSPTSSPGRSPSEPTGSSTTTRT